MKKILWILALAVFVGTSCSKQLDIIPPSKITDEDMQAMMQEDPDVVLGGITSNLVVSLYDNKITLSNDVRYNSHLNFDLAHNLRGNDMVHLNLGWYNDEYKMINYREESTEFCVMFWTYYYKVVYNSNVLLTLIKDDLLTDDDAGKKIKAYKATALVMRSWAYMHLLWLYSDDPLMGTNTAGVPFYTVQEDGSYVWEPVDRSPSAEIWNTIIADLETAVSLFEQSGKDPDASMTDIDVNVANLWLCRAAITTGAWDKVIKAAQAIYDERGGWNLMTEEQYVGGIDKENGFVRGAQNTEALFTVGYSNTYHSGVFAGTSFTGWMNILGGGYGGQSGGYQAIDQRLYDQIGENDYRKKNFLAEDMYYTYTGTGTVPDEPQLLRKYCNLKFATNLDPFEGTANYLGDETFMRTSEALLMKAEAEYRSGNESAARTTLQELASARGAADVTESGDALFKRIQLEFRIEMWGENGYEYYNNKRWGISVDRTGSANHTEMSSLPYGNAYTLQIPLDEYNYNQNLSSQNPL